MSTTYLFAFLIVAVLLGMLLSISALTLEEFSFRRHPRSREVARMMLYAVWDNFGYRQLVGVWRVMAFVDLLRGNRDWGAQRRRGFVTPPRQEDLVDSS